MNLSTCHQIWIAVEQAHVVTINFTALERETCLLLYYYVIAQGTSMASVPVPFFAIRFALYDLRTL